MRTLSLIAPLALFGGAAFAQGSIYHGLAGSGPFGNPDHSMLQYPTTLMQPAPSGFDIPVSLHSYQRGNPDGYAGVIEGYVPIEADSGPTITSLDTFQRGNPDHDHAVDYSLSVIGSDEAVVAAEARRAAATGGSRDGGV